MSLKKKFFPTKHGVIDTVIYLMEYCESWVDKTGKEKEQFVLSELKKTLGLESYQRYEPLLQLIIPFVVSVSKKQVVLQLNELKRKKYCFSCIGHE
jgi:hypothetical protein